MGITRKADGWAHNPRGVEVGCDTHQKDTSVGRWFWSGDPGAWSQTVCVLPRLFDFSVWFSARRPGFPNTVFHPKPHSFFKNTIFDCFPGDSSNFRPFSAGFSFPCGASGNLREAGPLKRVLVTLDQSENKNTERNALVQTKGCLGDSPREWWVIKRPQGLRGWCLRTHPGRCERAAGGPWHSTQTLLWTSPVTRGACLPE